MFKLKGNVNAINFGLPFPSLYN